MNRIEKKFDELKNKNEKALVAFVTAGDPDFDISAEIISSMCAAGVDVLELGVGFSDPTADGPVIQRASQRAIKSGMNLAKSIAMGKLIREKHPDVPIILFSYYNPILHYGLKRFYDDAVAAGCDGVLIVDLAHEESAEFTTVRTADDFSLIKLIAPTTPHERAEMLCKQAEGFVYLISRTGVTGTGGVDFSAVEDHCKEVQGISPVPVCMGFGVSTGDDVKQVAAYADGVVVGSAFEKIIEANLDNPDQLAKMMADKVSEFKAATKL